MTKRGKIERSEKKIKIFLDIDKKDSIEVDGKEIPMTKEVVRRGSKV